MTTTEIRLILKERRNTNSYCHLIMHAPVIHGGMFIMYIKCIYQLEIKGSKRYGYTTQEHVYNDICIKYNLQFNKMKIHWK